MNAASEGIADAEEFVTVMVDLVSGTTFGGSVNDRDLLNIGYRSSERAVNPMM